MCVVYRPFVDVVYLACELDQVKGSPSLFFYPNGSTQLAPFDVEDMTRKINISFITAGYVCQTTWLPKLPVPALEQTMAGYLEAVEVAVGDQSQREETRRLVEQFLRPDGIGPKFQELLVEKQAKEDNWVNAVATIYKYIFSSPTHRIRIDWLDYRPTIGGWKTCTWLTISPCQSILIREWFSHHEVNRKVWPILLVM